MPSASCISLMVILMLKVESKIVAEQFEMDFFSSQRKYDDISFESSAGQMVFCDFVKRLTSL